jgi:hypothetical protein
VPQAIPAAVTSSFPEGSTSNLLFFFAVTGVRRHGSVVYLAPVHFWIRD